MPSSAASLATVESSREVANRTTLPLHPAAHTLPPRRYLPAAVPIAPHPVRCHIHYPCAHVHRLRHAAHQSQDPGQSCALPPSPPASLTHLNTSTLIHFITSPTRPTKSQKKNLKRNERLTNHIPNPPLHILQQPLRPSLHTTLAIRIANHLPAHVRRRRRARVVYQRCAVRQRRLQGCAIGCESWLTEGQHVEGL
jgi:hypothetical protein